MESVTPSQLFELLGRLYVSREVAAAERDQAREQLQRLARKLEPQTEANQPAEVAPSPTT